VEQVSQDPADQGPISLGTTFRTRRSSPGYEHQRSLELDFKSHNGSIYLTEHEYGGRSICPTIEDLRWLRDVLNRMEFCDHDLGEIESTLIWGKSERRQYRVCRKCHDWIYEGPVETTFTWGEIKS